MRGLMSELGYERYGACGGAFVAGVATLVALDEPESLVGIHLNTMEMSRQLDGTSRPLWDAEKKYLAQRDKWDAAERGYSAVQPTKP